MHVKATVRLCVCVFWKSSSSGISPIHIRRTRSGVADSPSVVWLSSRVCSAVLLCCVREMWCRAGFGAGGGCAAASSEGELLRWLCCVSKGNDSDDAEKISGKEENNNNDLAICENNKAKENSRGRYSTRNGNKMVVDRINKGRKIKGKKIF